MSGRQELRDDRTGFSLVELLMVAVVGSLIVIAGGQMFVSQSRLFIAQREILDSRESLRAATILLTGEIHEISAADGDLFSAQRDSLVLRSVQGAGVVCSHAWYGSARRLGIRQATGEIGDSLLAFCPSSNDWGVHPITASWGGSNSWDPAPSGGARRSASGVTARPPTLVPRRPSS